MPSRRLPYDYTRDSFLENRAKAEWWVEVTLGSRFTRVICMRSCLRSCSEPAWGPFLRTFLYLLILSPLPCLILPLDLRICVLKLLGKLTLGPNRSFLLPGWCAGLQSRWIGKGSFLAVAVWREIRCALKVDSQVFVTDCHPGTSTPLYPVRDSLKEADFVLTRCSTLCQYLCFMVALVSLQIISRLVDENRNKDQNVFEPAVCLCADATH